MVDQPDQQVPPQDSQGRRVQQVSLGRSEPLAHLVLGVRREIRVIPDPLGNRGWWGLQGHKVLLVYRVQWGHRVPWAMMEPLVPWVLRVCRDFRELVSWDQQGLMAHKGQVVLLDRLVPWEDPLAQQVRKVSLVQPVHRQVLRVHRGGRASRVRMGQRARQVLRAPRA